MSHYKADPSRNVNLTIDGIPVTVPEGTRILEAARKVNIHIPTLCDHPDLCKRAVCRLCVVECDGRGKLVAACANDVWEGVNIVTCNHRIIGIRKTIIELLLANHPQECLSCVRNKNCRLQTLAADICIREPVFGNEAENTGPPVTESATLVRDMSKCIKCGRCTDACQEQTIRNIDTSHRGSRYKIGAPYDQAFAEGPCVFCGHCASVCPVGAIYGNDQSAGAWEALNDTGHHTAVQFMPELSEALDEPGLQAGVTPGKIVTALKRLGFDRVFNSQTFIDAAGTEEINELLDRRANGSRSQKPPLPIITGCSSGYIKFVEDSYPDLADRLTASKNPRQIFAGLMQGPQTTAVTISPCIAQKFAGKSSQDAGLVLTINELARMFRLAGIEFAGLPETSFDICAEAPLKAETNPSEAKILTVYGFAHARETMDSIRRGECDADIVKIMSCPRRDRAACGHSE